MKDIKYIVIFVAIGLGLAYAVSGPLRHPPERMVGTPLRPMGGGSTVATSKSAPEKIQLYAQGSVVLAEGLGKSFIMGRPLFIIVRASVEGRPTGGPPIAVRRIDTPTFPFSYSLTNENNMVGSDFYDGDILVIARLDKDGVAGPKQPEDFEGTALIRQGSSREIQITIQP